MWTHGVHEPRLGRAGHGGMEVVLHHYLIATSSENGGGVDLEELGGVDRHVILLQCHL
jgi:hypothetical protein